MLEREVVNRGVPSGVTCLWAGCDAACDAGVGAAAVESMASTCYQAFLIKCYEEFYKFHLFLFEKLMMEYRCR